MSDLFLKRRLGDPRFQSRASALAPATAVTPWFLNSTSLSADVGLPYLRSNAAKFSREKIAALENRSSSDDSDSGRCWSGYEEADGIAAGEKGSCVKKGSKKKKRKKTENKDD